jgi:hypothetical protein
MKIGYPMSTKTIILLTFILLFWVFDARSSQKENSYYYQNAIYKQNIKTVQLFNEENELSIPIIELGSKTRLLLKFDELSDEPGQYSYTLIHCDSHWNESYIQQMDYLTGFADNPLDDYAMSFNTTV